MKRLLAKLFKSTQTTSPLKQKMTFVLTRDHLEQAASQDNQVSASKRH
tara:strand:+ start:498 stop:641 length:144 start_codon:yes stop_codon:yes gene_type:complete